MLTLSEMYAQYQERRATQSPLISRWREVADTYDGKITIPLPELDKNERAAIPNLIAQGLDSLAQRAASTMPDLDCPPLRPNIVGSVKKATDRRLALLGMWEASDMALGLYQRFRWFGGYGAGPCILRPDPKSGTMMWEPRNPMGALPGLSTRPFSPVVPDCFFPVTRSRSWLRANYPGVALPNGRDDETVEVVEYTSAEQNSLFVVGPGTPGREMETWTGNQWDRPGTYGGYWSERGKHIERVAGAGDPTNRHWLLLLENAENPVGRCLATHPGQISLSVVAGHFDKILGMYMSAARLSALEQLAVERGVFPNEWFQETVEGQGEIVTLADGRRGVVGHVKGGQVVVTQIQPGIRADQAIDRLERNQRSTARLPSQFGGEAPVNVRTGRAGNAVVSETVDPLLREWQQIFQTSMTEECQIAAASQKAFFGSRSVSFYVSWQKEKGRVEYVPRELWETTECKVAYSSPGSDLNALVIAVGQLRGMEIISKATTRRLLPMVEDPEFEDQEQDVETLRAALMGVLLPSLAERQPAEVAQMIKDRRAGKSIEDVVEAADKRASERQASSGALGEPDGPVLPGSPEAQPGLALPGGGAEAPAAVPEVPPSLANLSQLHAAIRRSSTPIPTSRAG